MTIKQIEAQVADKNMSGFFTKFRRCHNSDSACCRGFWNRHKDDFVVGQIAQRLDCVEFVNHKGINHDS